MTQRVYLISIVQAEWLKFIHSDVFRNELFENITCFKIDRNIYKIQ